MKPILILLFILMIFVTGFSQSNDIDPEGYNKFYYGNGQISSEGMMKDGKPEGFWKTYYVDGTLKSEGNRKLFQLDSIWIFFDMDGDTLEVINYNFGKKNGYYLTYTYRKEGQDSIKAGGVYSKELYLNNKKQGLSYYYRPDHSLEFTYYYLDGVKHGLGNEFDTDGRLITVFEFHNGYQINKEKINRYDSDRKKSGVWKEYYYGNKVRKEINYQKDSLHGYYREFDRQGKLLKIERYENGRLTEDNPEIEQDSLLIQIKNEYYEGGGLKFIGSYLNEVPIGTHREYDEKGKVRNSKLYSNDGVLEGMGILDEEGLKQGDWEIYYESGMILGSGKYKDGKRTGKWEFFFEDGKVEQKGKYKGDKLQGTWEWYYLSGKLRSEENYENGLEEGKFIEYYENGDVVYEGEYFDGEKSGKWTYHIGCQTETGTFKDGLKDGIWESYYLDGTLKYKGNYIQGLEDGKHKIYFPKGKLYKEEEFVMGAREGNWKEYDEEGLLIVVILFKNDEEFRINGSRLKLPDDPEN